MTKDGHAYSVGMGNDGLWFVDGPGQGNSYYSGYLWSERRFSDEKLAQVVCHMMNQAFQEGRRWQTDVIHKALGL